MISKLQATLVSLDLAPITREQDASFAVYLELLEKWGLKMNLTSIRGEAVVLQRHFVESIQCARSIPSGVETLLDFGSGAGFPGIPIAICRTDIQVTLAESQAKKSSFLREVLRSIGIKGRVYGGRVDTMPTDAIFDVVSVRAVDRMEAACSEALTRVRPRGYLCVLSTCKQTARYARAFPGVDWLDPFELAGSDQGVVLLGRRRPQNVPRGTF